MQTEKGNNMTIYAIISASLVWFLILAGIICLIVLEIKIRNRGG